MLVMFLLRVLGRGTIAARLHMVEVGGGLEGEGVRALLLIQC